MKRVYSFCIRGMRLCFHQIHTNPGKHKQSQFVRNSAVDVCSGMNCLWGSLFLISWCITSINCLVFAMIAIASKRRVRSAPSAKGLRINGQSEHIFAR